ncbi:MAG: hypothetical protein ACTSVV_05405, partial [Promethearchaeota archaeon]
MKLYINNKFKFKYYDQKLEEIYSSIEYIESIQKIQSNNSIYITSHNDFILRNKDYNSELKKFNGFLILLIIPPIDVSEYTLGILNNKISIKTENVINHDYDYRVKITYNEYSDLNLMIYHNKYFETIRLFSGNYEKILINNYNKIVLFELNFLPPFNNISIFFSTLYLLDKSLYTQVKDLTQLFFIF